MRLTASISALAAAVGAAASVVPEAAAPVTQRDQAAAAGRPLATAVMDPELFAGPHAAAAFQRSRSAGATVVRLILRWGDVAPAGPTPPVGFTATDPGEPRYRWTAFDRQLRLAAAQGLQPLVNIAGEAPRWAEGRGDGPAGSVRPRPADLGRFARAAATRYSGTFEDLPRVRYWQVWNEPNLSTFLSPQFVGRRPFSPGHYRQMVNAFAAAVKGVRRDNVVVAGGTAPFRDVTPAVRAVNPRWGPLTFMRELLCLSRKLRKTCDAKIRFDVWAHHPYTSGGPSRKAQLADDVSLGDLPEMKRVLDAAYRAGRIAAPRRPEFWVTEFSWDSKPPDLNGLPIWLHRRWIAEGLYRMWSSGVSLVTWFTLRDYPVTQNHYQSGLYYFARDLGRAKPKPGLQAFRFPLVAFPRTTGVFVWGRTPGGQPRRVIVEQSFRGGWRRLGVLRANRHGIFQRTFRTGKRGVVRARLVSTGERAVPFSLRRVPDRFFGVFGIRIETGG